MPRTRGKAASSHRGLLKSRDYMGAAVLLLTIVCTFVACNVSNLVNEPRPGYVSGFAQCQPTFLFYPDPRRSLGFSPPIIDGLHPPKSAVRKALRTIKACTHPNKLNLNPGAKVIEHRRTHVLDVLETAQDKLNGWDSYTDFEENPRYREGPESWKKNPYMDDPRDTSFPHFKTEGCAPCTWGPASRATAYKLMTPYWWHANATPHTMADVAQYCPPCSVATLSEAWREIATFRVFPYPHIEWNATILPPQGVSDFYYGSVFDRS